MTGRVCIYCLQEKDTPAFNTEHVIPRAFGVFEQNLTLDCVCADCNAEFGRTIDLSLGRDSLEAFLRLIHGAKPAQEAGELGSRRLSVTLGGDLGWEGCHIVMCEEKGEVVVNPVPQVRFTTRQGGHVFVTEEHLADTTRALPASIDLDKQIGVFSCSGEMHARLIALLALRGIAFKQAGVDGSPLSHRMKDSPRSALLSAST